MGVIIVLQVSLDTISTIVKDLRHDAYLNGIDEIHFVQKLNQELESRIAYCAERIHLKRDIGQLRNGLCFTGAGILGLGAAVFGIKYKQALTHVLHKYIKDIDEHGIIGLSIGVGAAAVCALVFSRVNFEKWLHPCYQEKHEQLLRVRETVKHAFVEPFVDSVKIVKL